MVGIEVMMGGLTDEKQQRDLLHRGRRKSEFELHVFGDAVWYGVSYVRGQTPNSRGEMGLCDL